MATTPSYLDKVFRQPDYIWSEGSANVDVIAATVENDHVQRLQWLAGTPSADQPAPSESKILAPVTNQPPVLPPPLSSAKPTDGTILPSTGSAIDQGPPKPGADRNTVVPLLSLVWNGAEPQNYVRSPSSAGTTN